uniref:Uncharacterized protein n=1 Tax=Chelydra serpentina TaxID=8475 RepID=A0A8C3RZI4_CHESE
MAKWLTKYFSLGNNKAKSPPQPPRPDYRDRRPGLLRAYRAQKERDFEDPYSGPGSSLERRPPTPPDGRYLSPKHRLIKIDSGCEGGAAPAVTWSPPGGAGKKVGKCPEPPESSAPSAKPEKVREPPGVGRELAPGLAGQRLRARAAGGGCRGTCWLSGQPGKRSPKPQAWQGCDLGSAQRAPVCRELK